VVQSPSNHDVEQAIRRLDGMEFHDVHLLTSDPTAFLEICGGPDWYGVIVTEHDRLANIVNIHELNEDIEEVMCGGQPSGFPRCNLVDLHTALAAAIHYLDNAEATATLYWEWVPL
jgi:hypothetical protein